ncbi:PREDICTED: dnaJ homolog subfamily C member 28 isoform X1 [Rhagoletis zephyria]|uniref:dnaJ homolog subfamily C member 28 isoform X1 n=2 Tax=Rhagoletis zephyria TaxID=28612 RepID=UPI0008117DE1|nr:PREDICTED: dnaJ homolog subfamily C member 28 isoform X1 [Rhagoletis zephyria]
MVNFLYIQLGYLTAFNHRPSIAVVNSPIFYRNQVFFYKMLPVGVQFKLLPSFCWRKATLQCRGMHIKRVELYKKCFRILGVNEAADQNTVRNAYIDLVKRVHPDSGLPEASAERFQEVDEAFKVLQEKFAKNRRNIFEDEEEEVFDIKHTAPQHRQYLSYDGVGVGNPFQRQKQYQQIKAMKAQERVLSHRIEKSQAGERTIMKKGTFYKNHAIKTKYGFDRICEDLIQEAMAKGDFDNLRCAGKPLSSAQTQNPYLDFTTHKLNKILLDNGFTPEWITLQRDIREAVQRLRDELRAERCFFGDYPLNEKESSAWQQVLKRYSDDVKLINKNIDKYNLIVPILQNQLFRVNIDKVSEQVLSDPEALKHFKRQDETTSVKQNSGNVSKTDIFSFIGSLF